MKLSSQPCALATNFGKEPHGTLSSSLGWLQRQSGHLLKRRDISLVFVRIWTPECLVHRLITLLLAVSFTEKQKIFQGTEVVRNHTADRKYVIRGSTKKICH